MCEQCEVVSINGVNCHELGCPDSWKDYKVSCDWCGSEFMPEVKDQVLCDSDCAEAYYSG